MNSEVVTRVEKSTIVPAGIDDPIARARIELQATLAAIEQKANLPRRAGLALERGAERLRGFAKGSPAVAIAGAVTAATVVGGIAWGITRLITRG